jgi:hypothetical protein
VQLQVMVRRRGSWRRREAESNCRESRETERERAEGPRESGETERELRLDDDKGWGRSDGAQVHDGGRLGVEAHARPAGYQLSRAG